MHAHHQRTCRSTIFFSFVLRSVRLTLDANSYISHLSFQNSPRHRKAAPPHRYFLYAFCVVFHVPAKQWRRKEVESGGATRKISFVLPIHCFGSTSTISRFCARFGDGQCSLASFLFAVLLLTVPPCPVEWASAKPRHLQVENNCLIDLVRFIAPPDSEQIISGTRVKNILRFG